MHVCLHVCFLSYTKNDMCAEKKQLAFAQFIIIYVNMCTWFIESTYFFLREYSH